MMQAYSMRLCLQRASMITLAALMLTAVRFRFACAADPSKPEYLYAWSGAQNASLARDSLFVFSADPGPDFGKLLNIIETPYNGLEPHHCRSSVDGRWLACSALLAALSGLPTILFFDLTNPAKPVLLHNATMPPNSAFADEFAATPDGGFVVTMMGDKNGRAPGRVARYDANLNLMGEFPKNVSTIPQANSFNPHGIAADFNHNTMMTVDYLEPESTLVGFNLTARNTARLWDLRDLSIITTYTLPKSVRAKGAMDAVATGRGGYFFTGGNGYVFYLDPTDPKERKRSGPAIVFDGGVRSSESCILQPFRGGTRLLLALFDLDRLILLDTSNPRKPVLLDLYQFPKGTGGHVVRVSRNERLLALATYFLEEGAAGQIHAPGDCTIRFLQLDAQGKRFIRDPWPYARGPTINFTEIAPGKGGFRTHGIAFL